MGRRIVAGLLVIVWWLTAGTVMGLTAGEQDSPPLKITAEVIDYNSKTGEVAATGRVRFSQGDDWLDCEQAVYNNNKGDGVLTGGVRGLYRGIGLQADRVELQGRNFIRCHGNPVVVTSASRRFSGRQIDYDDRQKYVESPLPAIVEVDDASLSGDRMRGWLKENHLIVSGNVHARSASRQADLWCGQAEYFGLPEDETGRVVRQPGQQPKLVLTIDPHGQQAGNQLAGTVITVYLDDQATEVDGQARVTVARDDGGER
ncbi:MAG: hypothetical protein N3A57_01380 [Negativicutes bacterium]|nr:hypothetical protein [Negativicutes bacterium]